MKHIINTNKVLKNIGKILSKTIIGILIMFFLIFTYLYIASDLWFRSQEITMDEMMSFDSFEDPIDSKE